MRYQNHEKLAGYSPFVQRKLQKSRILVAGCGGLGSNAALFLAGAGVGTLDLVDPDVVELQNLHRQVLFEEGDVGLHKVTSAKARLMARNSEILINDHNKRIDTASIDDLVTPVDLVVVATDNFESRDLLNDACLRLNKPMVHASVGAFSGEVCVFNGQRGPCYRCLYPSSDPLACDCEDSGVFGPLVGAIASLQAGEAIKLLSGVGNPLFGTLVRINLADPTFETFEFEKDQSCSVCSGQVTDGANLATNVGTGPSTALELDGADLVRALSDPSYTFIDLRELDEGLLTLKPTGNRLQVPYQTLLDRHQDFSADASRTLVFFCATGKRSQRAAAFMAGQAFPNVRHIAGGIGNIALAAFVVPKASSTVAHSTMAHSTLAHSSATESPLVPTS